MVTKKKLPYVRVAFYRGRRAALNEASRLRKTGGYNAKVLRTDIPNHYAWTLWTQLKRR